MRCSTLRGGYHTGRVLHGGRTLVDSATLCFAAPLLDLQPHDSRRVRWDPRGPYDQGAKRLKNKRSLDPLDLDAGSPVTSRSIRFGQPAELPLLGFPKTAPPSYRAEESDARVRCPLQRELPLRSIPSGMDCRPSRVPPAWFCTTSAVSPLRPCRSVSPCCRSWGSPRFPSSRNEDPRGALLPSEAFPPLTAFTPAFTGASRRAVRSRDRPSAERERHRVRPASVP